MKVHKNECEGEFAYGIATAMHVMIDRELSFLNSTTTPTAWLQQPTSRALCFPNAIYTSRTMPDPTTQSNYLSVTTEHVEFRWDVDFETHIIEGSAHHSMLVKDDVVHEVMLVVKYFSRLCGRD